MSDTPISSAIRTATTMSTLVRMHHCHPHPLALVIMRKDDWVFLFDRNQFCHQFIQHFAARTTRKGGIDWWSRNYDGSIRRTFRSALLWNAWLSISLEVQCMNQRFIGILELRLSLIDLGGMTSVLLQLERSEPTTWEATSAQVQKHNLSTMLSNRADNDSFSNSKAFTLNSDCSIHSFNTSILAYCLLT